MKGPQVTAVAGSIVSVAMPCSIPLRLAGRKLAACQPGGPPAAGPARPAATMIQGS
jgi:hypothetical protein